MGPLVRRRLVIASRRRRLMAGIIDAGVFLVGVGSVVAALVKFYPHYRNRRPDETGADEDEGLDPINELLRRVSRALPNLNRGTSGGRVLAVAGWVIAVSARNRRSPGYRVVGIRRVDARRGGAVTIRSAVIHLASREGWAWLTRQAMGPAQRRASQRTKDFRAQVDEIKRQHADDPDAGQDAITSLYKSADVNCLTPIVWGLPAVLAGPLSSLLSGSHQTIGDRLSGTVIVRDQ
jgi:hypothetical protein